MSQNWKLHLLFTFTISIVVKGNFVRHNKRIKLENHFIRMLIAEIKCSLDLSLLCGLVVPQVSLWCLWAVGFPSTSGLPLK